jgi:hypothetical protein
MATCSGRVIGAREHSDRGFCGRRRSTARANVELMEMAQHRFKVGQVVDFSPAKPGTPTPGHQYVIVRLLPSRVVSSSIA